MLEASCVYLISLCTVMRFNAGLYFLSSNRSGVFFLFFCVVYLLGDMPSPRASVHSMVMMHRTPFFRAIQVTWRGPTARGGVTATLKRAGATKELRSWTILFNSHTANVRIPLTKSCTLGRCGNCLL